MLEPAEFFAATQQYGSPSRVASMRFATVDPAYSGTGPARVMFDGETLLTVKPYQFVGSPPVAGKRVRMTPVSNTYVIDGMLNGGA